MKMSLRFYFLVVSTFGITGWYADLFKRFIPDWAGLIILMLPVTIVLFIEWGELPSVIVARAHIFAASLFMLLSMGMELGYLWDYRPEGALFFKILANLGWIFAWGAILGRGRQFRHSKQRERKPDDKTW